MRKRTRVVDLLDLADPDRISEPARRGDVGIGERFSMPDHYGPSQRRAVASSQ